MNKNCIKHSVNFNPVLRTACCSFSAPFPSSKLLILTSGIRDSSILASPSLPHDHYTRFQKFHGAMEPNMKMVLEEIQKSREESARRFDEHDAK